MVCRMSAKIQNEKRNETNLLKWLNYGNISSTYPFLFAVRCSSLFVHNREGDVKMSVENKKMQTDVANEQQIQRRKENVVFVESDCLLFLPLLILSYS